MFTKGTAMLKFACIKKTFHNLSTYLLYDGKIKTEQQETKHANPISAAMFLTIRMVSIVFFTKSGKQPMIDKA